MLENFNSFAQLFRPRIFAMTNISQNWNRNASKSLCAVPVILLYFNQKWKMSTCFEDTFHYKMSSISVSQFSGCHIGSETTLHVFVTLCCKHAKNLSQV
jgi:hypothetical protein